MRKIEEIQVLRAFAALAVVVAHAITRVERSLEGTAAADSLAWLGRYAHFGHAGVDLFFVISGFVMVYAHYEAFRKPGAVGKFLSRRAARIAPIYWLLTTVGVVLLAQAPQLFYYRDSLDWAWVAASYLFVPLASADGVECPVLGVGWTLNFEMYFYAVFAIALMAPRRVGLLAMAAFFAASIAAGLVLRPESLMAKQVTSWLLAEFGLGCAVAWLTVNRPQRLRGSAPTVLTIGVLGVALGGFMAESTDHLSRLVFWGLPSAMIVAAAAASDWSRLPGHRLWLLLGNASYSIYLVQVFALPGVALVVKKAGLLQAAPPEVAITVLTVGAVAAGVAFWRVIEQPLGSWTSAMLRRKPAPAAIQPAATQA